MSETSAPAEDLLVIGKIVSVHGVRGDVKVYSFTDPIDNLLDYHSWTLRRGEEVRQVQVTKGRVQGNVLVASLKGVGDRDVARDYVDFEICIPRDLLPALDEGEYYWHQLQGLKVIDALGQLLGVVDHLLETGANDVLVVKPCVGSLDDRERLLPYTDQCVQQIDLVAGEMRVDWDADF
ncbi:ribosome maturation factor RimM [Stutzerimonas balearica]|jgi:16S rRNA processing protein RimM|uniref:ribosome maturation factor RimM n=1 Tax=Stutzerimonas balearica TaxID=74829 RepID=UPI00190A498B|nr:ribosome maturation factor RimM [Stutzerimonas balearica]MBK3749344.1 ribosome maturation factor RimM [Stutzerimonas balearica]MBK3827539.1 ribosome maturation factor RimM [Stutzerimonas balearica]MBK3857225.1 ribosome maturation factor RimM [Stutzerimonas balearica]WAN08865.1 ribosome maturation factor RimM [Stutzerimonas balearica]